MGLFHGSHAEPRDNAVGHPEVPELYNNLGVLLNREPDSPAILAWRARAYLTGDRREPGVAAFRQLQATAPRGTRLVTDLQQQFPFLLPARAD